MRKLLILPMILSLFSCVEKDTVVIVKKELFHLSMGKAEDQIDLIQLPGMPFKERSRIVMKNGLFYISNGNTGKVMEFNSYGDILTLYYNPEKNPPPLLLDTGTKRSEVSNRKAFRYSFNHIGEIEVASNGELLVDDEVPGNRVEYDEESGSVLNRIVFRFSKQGELYGFLGQEGLGGTPFPYIERLAINDAGDIIVFSRTVKTRIVYWFTGKGTLLYTITFPLAALPGIEGKPSIPFLDSINVSRTDRTLFLKIDYYTPISNGEDTAAAESGEYIESRVWKFSVSENRYTGSIIIPGVAKNVYGDKAKTKTDDDYIYSFLGSDKFGRFFFLVHLDMNQFQLLVLSRDGTVISKNRISMDDNDISYSSFYLTDEGLLTAMLAKEDRVDIVWWRTDRIKGAGNERTN